MQEALEMRRPEFICQSKQRVRRLALQAEERRLQATLGRDRRRLYNQPGELGRLLKSAGIQATTASVAKFNKVFTPLSPCITRQPQNEALFLKATD